MLSQKDINRLQGKRLFLLDMDGTIYLGDRLFDGTKELLNYIHSVGGTYYFFSNNSSRGTEQYIEKLRKMGISSSPADYITSVDALIEYLKETDPEGKRKCYVCGTVSFLSSLREAGINVTAEPEKDVSTLILGYDTELTYQKLRDCCVLLRRNTEYIATHPDMVCPDPDGPMPDCGSVIEMLDTACQRRPEIIGKPKPYMVDLALKRTGFSKEETILLGDRIYTDIACGIHAGIDTLFLLTGESTREDIERFQMVPSFIFEDLNSLCKILKQP